ncbi:hypothetical protein TNCV_3465591 [Trichonephila clavipes]|nr:hypothetical protein TNCV_3465591 [Trichonephila clavipes]
MEIIEQCYSHRSTAPETHTVKRALNSPFTNCTTGTVIQRPRLHGRKMPAKIPGRIRFVPVYMATRQNPGRNAGTFFIPSFD